MILFFSNYIDYSLNILLFSSSIEKLNISGKLISSSTYSSLFV